MGLFWILNFPTKIILPKSSYWNWFSPWLYIWENKWKKWSRKERSMTESNAFLLEHGSVNPFSFYHSSRKDFYQLTSIYVYIYYVEYKQNIGLTVHSSKFQDLWSMKSSSEIVLQNLPYFLNKETLLLSWAQTLKFWRVSVSKGTLYVVELHYLQVLKRAKRQKFLENKYAVIFLHK